MGSIKWYSVGFISGIVPGRLGDENDKAKVSLGRVEHKWSGTGSPELVSSAIPVMRISPDSLPKAFWVSLYYVWECAIKKREIG